MDGIIATPSAENAPAADSEGEQWRGEFGPAEATRVSRREAAALSERGRYLVEFVAVCGTCHAGAKHVAGSALSGGRPLTDRFGEVRAANITPDKKTGIGSWSVSELMRALRSSIDREGRPMSLDVHSSYRWMSDRDARAIGVYLKSQKPVENLVQRRELGTLDKKKWGLVPRHSVISGYVPDLLRRPTYQYGRYLVDHVASCGRCHTDNLSREEIGSAWQAGENSLQGASVEQSGLRSSEMSEETKFRAAPNIRGTSAEGLARWTVDDIVEYLSQGKTPQGSISARADCPWWAYQGMTESDKRAIAEYLKRL